MAEKRDRYWCKPSPLPPSQTSEPPQMNENSQRSSQDISKMVHDQLNKKMAAAGLVSRDENVSSSSDSYDRSNADEEISELDCAHRLLTLLSKWGSCESLERDIIEEINYNEKEDVQGFELRPVYEAFQLNAIERPWEEKLDRSLVNYENVDNDESSVSIKSPLRCCLEEKHACELTSKESSESVTPSSPDQDHVIINPVPIQVEAQSISFYVSPSSIQPPNYYVYNCDQSAEQLLCSFAHTLFYLLKATYVKVYVYDPFSFLLKESIMFHVLNRNPIGWNVEERNCFATEAVRRQKTMIVPDVNHVTEEYPEGLGFPVDDNVHSLLCIPVPFFNTYDLIELGRPKSLNWSNLESNFVTILVKWLTLSDKHSQNNICQFPLWQIHNYMKDLVEQYYLDENLPKSIQSCCNFVKHITRSEQTSFIVILNGNIAVFYRHSGNDGNRYVKKDMRVLSDILNETDGTYSNMQNRSNGDCHNSKKFSENVNNSRNSVNKDKTSAEETHQNEDSSKSLHKIILEDLNNKLSKTLHRLTTDETCQMTNEEENNMICEHVKDEDIVQYIRRTKQCVLINDTKQCEQAFLKPLTENPDADSLVIKSLLCIPIVSSSNSVLGIINIFNKMGTGFKLNDQYLVGIVTSYFTLILAHQLMKHDLVRLRTEYELVFGILEHCPTKEKTMCEHRYSFNNQSQSNVQYSHEDKYKSSREHQCNKLKQRFWDPSTKGDEKSSTHSDESSESDGNSNKNAGLGVEKNPRTEAEKEDTKNSTLETEKNAREDDEEVDIFWDEFYCKSRPEFFTYAWYPNASEILELSSYIYCMLRKVFGGSRLFDKEVVQDFIRLVEEFYHPNRFHNFLQGVLCMHFIYVTINNNSQVWTGVEKIALLLSGLCQYISHPGFTIRNSTMELHHYKVTEILVAKSGLFRNEPELGKVIMEKLRLFMISIQHPTHAQTVNNISTALSTTGMDWSKPEHREWIHTLLINTSKLNIMCKPYLECRKNLISFLQYTEQPSKQCTDIITMLKEFDLDGKAFIQFYFLSHLIPSNDHLLYLVHENLSLLYENQK